MFHDQRRARNIRLLAGWVIVVSASCTAAAAEPERLPPPPTLLEAATSPLIDSPFLPLSAQSCAANACHGAAHPGVADPYAGRGSEYTLWVERDPHARARQTLCSVKSVKMLEALKIVDRGQVIDPAGYRNCLACHATTGATECGSDFGAIHEGVGCAACHGPAQVWIGTHYQPSFDDGEKAATGFVPLDSLIVRARVCASCHVGDSDRDMNHDIIAAGHPPLRYEFATYYHRLPKHWRDEEAGDPSVFEAQLWLAGQIAAVDASLALLESRASKRNAVSVWPELSEYDCGSCHHSQRPPGPNTAAPPSRGLARYSEWNKAGLRLMLTHDGIPSHSTRLGANLVADLDQVRNVMQRSFSPDEVETLNASRAARHALDAWLKQQGCSFHARFDGFALNAKLHAVARERGIPSEWESATQWYLAAVAARDTWPGGRRGLPWPLAQSTREALRYPADSDIESDSSLAPETGERLQALLESLVPDNHDDRDGNREWRVLEQPHPGP